MKMLKCSRCCAYTLLPACPTCGAPARSCHPPRFTQRYAKYMRIAKRGLT